MTVAAAAAGFLLCPAPAQASTGELRISSVDVASPAKLTGAVKAKVHVDAPADSRVTFSVANPAKGSASINADGVLTYRPRAAARHRAARDGAPTADRVDVIRITVIDPSGQRASKRVRIPVLGANQEPVVSSVVVGLPDPQTGVVKGRVTATDADGDALVYRLVSDRSESSGRMTSDIDGVRVRSLQGEVFDLPYATAPTSQGSVSLQADGAFTYTPVATGASSSSASTDSFTVTVTDGYGGSTSIPVSVPIGGSYGGGIQLTATSIVPGQGWLPGN
jgi:VCBS repeat-containing protein